MHDRLFIINIFSVGFGGFIGSCLRYLISIYLSRIPCQIPLGTLTVNVIGGFLIGLFMELSLSTALIPPNLRLFIVTGILGGLTTFSTFSYETMSLFSEGAYISALLNVSLNLFLSLFAVILGRLILKLLFKLGGIFIGK
ncbi:camphor resistance protein CrcB [Methanothermus fervidus DSM 2088]|uniref:Fluoride-specific ion channel FluC n=1 Tax=Methanothermus fervidus (strain ATCC 43054 / DSM 2088 / JCM 10308 / V24 S) TaxID=523846 RepID=E3GYY7_METFV|nr:fluoride efflux transporter CrcB [Methanothermus fervidus]ADP77519.1 camphor resistance protein CrcB [Methanothermus fervidus DSM 2088]